MLSKRKATTDPVRVLELLWREPGYGRTCRGPKQGLTVDDVVTAALTIADAAGLDGLSMRAVAKPSRWHRCRSTPTFPGKTELCNLMLDNVYLAMPRLSSAATGAPNSPRSPMTTAACSWLIRGPLL